MKAKALKKWVVIAAVALAFIATKSLFTHPTFSDEIFYYNIGSQVLNGLVPYKDFFFAHPPLQPYVLATVFKVFGTNFLTAKTFSLAIAALCIAFTYLVSEEINRDLGPESLKKKPNIIAVTTFLVTPAFIAFSGMGYGMWEAMLLVLISMYILLRGDAGPNAENESTIKNQLLASLVFAGAVFFRYIAILYFPFIVLLLIVRRIRFKEFAAFTMFFTLTVFMVCLMVFGQNYMNDTVSYHLASKVQIDVPEIQKMQYWGIGFFSVFLALIALPVAYSEKDKTLLVLAITALIADAIMLLGLNLLFYHYFIISLPFYAIVTGRGLTVSKELIVKIMVPIVLVLAIISNVKTIDFYLNPGYASGFYEVSSFIESQDLENESVFGDPIMVSYLSFVHGMKVAGNYFDSYMQHLNFEGTGKVAGELKEYGPKVLIDMDNYYKSDKELSTVFEVYNMKMEFHGLPNYFVYVRKD